MSTQQTVYFVNYIDKILHNTVLHRFVQSQHNKLCFVHYIDKILHNTVVYVPPILNHIENIPLIRAIHYNCDHLPITSLQ